MKTLRAVNLLLAALAVLAPMAHLLELPNKLSLDAPLWLAVQQHLYRGWGPVIGAPTECGALLTSVLLVLARRRRPALLRPTAIACVGYAGMLVAFFTLNAPVNAAVASATLATLPPDWTRWRAHWEAGHAAAAAFSIVSLLALAWAGNAERRQQCAPRAAAT